MQRSNTATLTVVPPFVAIALGILFMGILIWYGTAIGAESGTSCDLPPALLSEEGNTLKSDEVVSIDRLLLPPMDEIKYGEIRTATFAMG